MREAHLKVGEKSSKNRKKADIELLTSEFLKLVEKSPEKSSKFLKYLSDEVQKITPDKKEQKSILSNFWKKKFSENLPTLKALQKVEKESKQRELF
jgi:hypothetical protein